MSFLLPAFLLLLLAVAALAGAYVFLQERRRHYAVRFTNVDLLGSIAPKRPGWRRHVPAAAVGLGLASLVVALAQPVHTIEVAQESKIIMLTMDVSRSMESTDVTPSRLEAAEEAAQKFVSELPQGVEVGLVSFAGTANLLVPPTDDHDLVISAVGNLESADGTATGSGIMTSLQAITNARTAEGVTPSGDEASAAIVLLSDGVSELGVPLSQATEAAVADNVPISTITFGTATGTVTFPTGETIPVPPDPAAMADVAQKTGGTAFDADSAEQLDQVYSQIQGEVGSTFEETDLWPWFVGLALILLMGACGAAMFWNARFL